MTITVTFHNDNVEALIADAQRIFPSLVAGTPLPPMQEQPNRDPEPAEPKEKKPRAKKEEVKADAGESAPAEKPSSTEAEKPAVVDIEIVRAKLKTLGATDGLGHDKVFELLGKYSAKNASTVPEDKRAALVADIDEALASVK